MVQFFVQTACAGTRVVRDVESVEALRAMVAEWEGAECVDDVRLMAYGRDLLDEDILDVAENATLFAALRLVGGGKKRKKKTYTKPKKIKHKHKKVKLAVLKYYKVSDDGKVTHLRRECPDERCGAGIFMANMKDKRQYCGLCFLTLIPENE
mmetsp:Transcript_11972/g.26115  ORF Transcript_11972/g.26115 Transcript_11972/m.26115 type:complete len:152 (-) Transcript_11972:585-1040(-)|eukprot:CAMPEP_0185846418 /NCGR_PEP_ID=MMETSP1354-20130828/2064_1 /TAXON_ID=708628 /ORGANISM="Erythrolobus madagascarensis, Strain CCMP3276" /LENGTH=151 /DNA_ID=CAMNT_0028546549 /DNA_START=103 /DNA_END=558 /DNA_ORIENTATION=-